MPTGPANRPPSPGAARRAAFEAVHAQHSREVWAVAYARRPDPDLALDVTQEAFLRLWKQWEAGADIQNPRAWLLRVARNLAEDHAKSAFRRNGTQPPELLNGVRSAHPAPAEALEREELFARIRAELAALAPADRDILTLRYALDYDAAKIADLLDVAVTAVHMRLSRARQRLADRLGPLDDLPPRTRDAPMTPSPLDAALTEFYRNEVPRPWPAAPGLAAPAAAARRDPARRPRLTLAASVAALAGACWLLSPGAAPPPGPAGGPAAGPDVLQNATARTPAAAGKAKAKAAADPLAGFQPGALPLP